MTVSIPPGLFPEKFRDVQLTSRGTLNRPKESQKEARYPPTGSIFDSTATDFQGRGDIGGIPYTYGGATSRFIVGALVLTAAGCRPDCSRSHRINVEKLLPRRGPERPTLFGTTKFDMECAKSRAQIPARDISDPPS